ncbi:MAG: hypothetical protein LBE09_08015, partial [Christensenellaceae bacterium]|nr:hypothetical protein [Christensenellaceae bacterium]
FFYLVSQFSRQCLLNWAGASRFSIQQALLTVFEKCLFVSPLQAQVICQIKQSRFPSENLRYHCLLISPYQSRIKSVRK